MSAVAGRAEAAIPWFNNFGIENDEDGQQGSWPNGAPGIRHFASISTMSAVDKISACSLISSHFPSSGHFESAGEYSDREFLHERSAKSAKSLRASKSAKNVRSTKSAKSFASPSTATLDYAPVAAPNYSSGAGPSSKPLQRVPKEEKQRDGANT